MKHIVQAASAAALLTALMACAQPPAPPAALPQASTAGPVLSAQNATAQSLPFSQNWTSVGLITANDDWSGVPGLEGYLGQDLTAATGVDPQTVLGTSAVTGDLTVLANQSSTSINNGDVAEFDGIANPTIALQGSGTADAPYVLIQVNTSGKTGINVAYNLRDLDATADNAVQPVALQYRVGTTGNFTNVPAGFVADATTGPSLASLVTPVSTTLPAAADNQPVVQIRVITTNAPGNDEWVGVDDISVTASGVAGDTAPTVIGTTPTNGALNVARDGNIVVNFSENVTFGPTAASLACPTGTNIPFTASNTANSLTLDPNASLPAGVTCTVTIAAAQVTDTDGAPNTLAANYTFSFTVLDDTPIPIGQIQGASHRSPRVGQTTTAEGVVTARRAQGFYIQSVTPDNNPATSEGLYVFTNTAPTVNVGDLVRVTGNVSEFRAGGASSANLSLTQLSGALVISTLAANQPLPAATVIGQGGRLPPPNAIAGAAPGGDVENAGYVFDPSSNGLDFYESLEGMRVAVNNAVTTGNTVLFGAANPATITREVVVLADDGANASVRTPRGGIVLRENDANPERIFLSDALFSGDQSGEVVLPEVGLGAHFPGTLSGILDYDFGEHKIYLTNLPAVQNSTLQREVTTVTAAPARLTVGSFNVENLDALDPQTKFDRLGSLIAKNLKSPDILVVEEIQDNDGPSGQTTSTAANATWDKLIAAITAQGGATYAYRQIDPVYNQDGGEQPGNIRVGFLFNPARVTFVDRPGGTATNAVSVQNVNGRPQLSFSPGRIDPTNSAWSSSRKPLVGEFLFGSQKVFVVGNHFNSKGGDGPAQGRIQPPVLSSEVQRVQQATLVRDFVRSILAVDPNANVVVAGDLNDFQFSNPLNILKATPLSALIETLPENERYSYVFDGNAQTIDHLLASTGLRAKLDGYDVVHVNAEFADQDSDHDPQVARFLLNSPPTVGTVQLTPSPAMKNEPVTARAPFTDVDQSGGMFQCAVDYGDGTGFLAGTVSNGTCIGPAHGYAQFGTYTVTVRVTDENGGAGTATATQKIQYYFTGFLLGTQNAPAINRWTSPITYLWFSLRGYQGPRPFAAGFPAYRPVDCNTLAPLGPWTQAYASVPAVQYDAASDRYAFVWTDFGAWSGCRELNVRLDDNTDHSAIYRR